MSSSLLFIPRKTRKTIQGRTIQPRTDSPKQNFEENGTYIAGITEAGLRHESNHIVAQNDLKGKGKATSANERVSKYTEADYARLLCLALSDYALWADPDLRSALDPSLSQTYHDDGGESSQAGAAYVPFRELFKRFPSQYGVQYPTKTLMTGIVKVLRAHAAELVDVRLALADDGGYELCRSDWTSEHFPSGLSYSRSDWEMRTVYVERIPTRYRSFPGILAFLGKLLDETATSSLHPWARIQAIKLPPHHQDQLGDRPTCKDFCLVTLFALDDAMFLKSQWPWTRKAAERTDRLEEGIEGTPQESKEASQFGFRTLSKAAWERLREEFLTYRGKLVDEIREYEDIHATEPSALTKRSRSPVPESDAESHHPITPDSPYPYGCLVFVRNIHPDTNKTTLRTLFSHSLKEYQSGGLDYIDYSKGMDSCYVRLSTPAHTDSLVHHFQERPTVQADGLDDQGTLVVSSTLKKTIVVEKITGRKEEVVWERVPEKVRKQAVLKAIDLLDGRMGQNGSAAPEHRKKRRRN